MRSVKVFWQYINAWSLRTRLLFIAVSCFGLLGAGLTIGVLLNLQPCPFCIFQRVLYLVIGFSALAAALFSRSLLATRVAVGLGVGAAIGGLITASYQTYMQLFPASVMECGFSEPTAIERFVDVLGTSWEFMFLATGLCSSVDWTFLGLSMANWSIPAFTAFGAMLLWALLGRAGK